MRVAILTKIYSASLWQLEYCGQCTYFRYVVTIGISLLELLVVGPQPYTTNRYTKEVIPILPF